MGWGSILGSVAGGVLGSVVPGIGTGIGASVGGLLGGAVDGSNAAEDASNAQREATAQSNATQRYMYDTTRQDNMPALESRNWALNELKARLSGALGGAITPQAVQKEAGYQFGLSEGLKGLNSQLTARGMRNSGAALKQAARYATDYASTKYDNAFNREVANRSAQLNPFQSLAGLAQTGASTVAASGQNYANNVSNNQTSLGNALGANALAQGNIWGGATNQLLSLGNQNGWFGKDSLGDTFDGNFLSGYTYKNPQLVGPSMNP